MLGIDDNVEKQGNPIPFVGGGLGAIFNHLTKQLSKELQNLNLGDGNKGIEIRFSTGIPNQKINRVATSKESLIGEEPIEESERERRKKLPVFSAESKIRRLPEGLIYEIDVPGVSSKRDVSILKMENSLEVKAYSPDKCYIKTIPLKADILKYGVKDEKIFVQIKN